MAAEIDYYGKFDVDLVQREQFRTGDLRKTWFEQYPDLFDELDLSQAINQPDYHFYEWYAAILIFQETGWRSLLDQYQFPKHKRKQAILAQLVDQQVLELITNSTKVYHVQCPDLLVYSPDLTDYFFCEVKGCTDRIRKEQLTFFSELKKCSSKRVSFIRFTPLRSGK